MKRLFLFMAKWIKRQEEESTGHERGQEAPCSFTLPGCSLPGERAHLGTPEHHLGEERRGAQTHLVATSGRKRARNWPELRR